MTMVSPTQEYDTDEDRRGRLERLNWPGLAMAAVLGLLAIGLGRAFGIMGPGLLDRLVGGPNPPATPGEVSQVTSTPSGLPAVVLTQTVTATAIPRRATLTFTPAPPTATGTLAPTLTFTPVPPTATPLPPPPTETPTPLPTETPTVLPTPTTTLTPTVAPTVGPNPTIVACISQVDQDIQAYLLQQDPATLEAFGCPDGPGLVGTAQSWPFEHGYIVGFDMTQEMLVVYTDIQKWERQLVPRRPGAASSRGCAARSGQRHPRVSTSPTAALGSCGSKESDATNSGLRSRRHRARSQPCTRLSPAR